MTLSAWVISTRSGHVRNLAGAAAAVLAFAAAPPGLASTPDSLPGSASSQDRASAAAQQPVPSAAIGPEQNPSLEVAHAVMVTVELDFGPKPPSIAEALEKVQRRSAPDDGVGRTFAILDAYGEPTPTGKLHMSMHVSTEKPGMAALVFKPTGEVLWQSRIQKGPEAPARNVATRGLIILMDNGAGQTVTIDGSKNPRSVLDATIKEMGVKVTDIWPEGAERELSFLYSACGCPVKVTCLRTGDKTSRTRSLPVIFPDDPAVVRVIQRLMRWD